MVVPDNDSLLSQSDFVAALLVAPAAPTLAYGEAARRPGLHVMRTPTTDRSETVTGLGGAGVEVMLALVDGARLPGHPMIPLLQVGADGDADLSDLDRSALVARLSETLSRRYRPVASSSRNVRFQLTRGELGVSL